MNSERKNLAIANRLFREGNLREAHSACTAVLNTQRQNPQAWYLLSNINFRVGRLDEAISNAQAATDLAPNQPELLVQLGTCLAASSHFGDALTIAETAAQLESAAPALLSNLGSLFSMCNDHNRAADFFQRAVKADESNAEYWYNLAAAQRMLGNLDDAEKSCNSAIDLNPQHGQAYYLRSDLRIQAPEANHIPELKALITASGGDTQNKILGSFALAKELEDIGEYQDSFSHLKTGAQSYRKSINYDVSDDIAAIDRIVNLHTHDALNETTPGYEEDAPIFIVGLPRSGTTLVERIIQSHSKVRSVGERNDFALEMSRLAAEKCDSEKPSREALVLNSLRIDMQELGSSYSSRIRSGPNDTIRILDKMPINYLYCGLIHAALPNAKIISLLRHPMDSCYAAYKAYLRGPYSFTYDLDELGRYYLAFRGLARHWRKTLPNSAYLEVEYETLVQNFEPEARRMFGFLELPWEDQVLEFQKNKAASSTGSAAQIRRGIYSTSIGKWKHYATELEPLRVILEQDIETL